MIRKSIKGIQIETPSASVDGGLRIRVSDINDFFVEGKNIEVKGTNTFNYKPVACEFVVSLFDCTAGRIIPIQCVASEFQEEDTSTFQAFVELGKPKSSLELPDWTSVAIISRDILIGPFRDSKNLMIVVRLVDIGFEHYFRHGQIESTDGVLWTGIKKFKYDLFDKVGYLDSLIRLQRFHFTCIDLAVLVAAAGGTVADQVIDVIYDKVYFWLDEACASPQIYDGYSSDEDRLKRYSEQVSLALQKAKDRKLSQSRLLTTLMQSRPPDSEAAELIEFCFDVMVVDETVSAPALELINKIAKTVKIDQEKLKKVRDEKIVRIGTASNIDISAEQLLGINTYWNPKKKVDYLESEFHKWNSRLNVVPEGATRENIHRMLALIGNAIKKYR